MPCLDVASVYCRAVGFFSSSALVELSKGLGPFAKNGGKIKLAVSPRLSREDFEQIRLGYAERRKLVLKRVIDSLLPPQGEEEAVRLSHLAHLIARRVLDIRVVFLSRGDGIGMYHEKIGYFQDLCGHIVAFSGSMNESHNAFFENYESLDVFASWTQDESRANGKREVFDRIWEGEEAGLTVVSGEELEEKIVELYQNGDFDPDFEANLRSKLQLRPDPVEDTLYDYQQFAVSAWIAAGFRGVFEMATGAGKTITAIKGVLELLTRFPRTLVIVACPFQNLADQWSDEFRVRGMDSIVCHSASNEPSWPSRLSRHVTQLNYSSGVPPQKVVITTIATFRSDEFQTQAGRQKNESLLVCDEVHNFGTDSLREVLKDAYSFRLGLSASFARHKDPEGTDSIRTFFGASCVTYTLEDALRDGRLCPFEYNPIEVVLDEDEQARYTELSDKIENRLRSVDPKARRSDRILQLLYQECDEIATVAKGKLEALSGLLSGNTMQSHVLVYCGSGRLMHAEHESSPNLLPRQIDAVTKLLGDGLQMRVGRYTSNESSGERKKLLDAFSKGTQIQVLAAIRCLDEGINVPAIKTAFLMSSSRNPKEFIQRRGRLLRHAPNKKLARIYDFVVMPMGYSPLVDGQRNALYDRLVFGELARIREYSSGSQNEVTSHRVVRDIERRFGPFVDFVE